MLVILPDFRSIDPSIGSRVGSVSQPTLMRPPRTPYGELVDCTKHMVARPAQYSIQCNRTTKGNLLQVSRCIKWEVLLIKSGHYCVGNFHFRTSLWRDHFFWCLGNKWLSINHFRSFIRHSSSGRSTTVAESSMYSMALVVAAAAAIVLFVNHPRRVVLHSNEDPTLWPV